MDKILGNCPSKGGQCTGKMCAWFDEYAQECGVTSTAKAIRQLHHTMRSLLYDKPICGVDFAVGKDLTVVDGKPVGERR